MILGGEAEMHIHAFNPDGTSLELDPEKEVCFEAETGIQDTEESK